MRCSLNRKYSEPERPRTLVVCGHPGHEVRIFGWLEALHPELFLLTGGKSDAGSLDPTFEILRQTQATAGCWFPRIAEAELHKALLRHDMGFFHQLVIELADIMEEREVELVLGDASEGYNTSHDVCRLLIDTAVLHCATTRNYSVANLSFPLIGPPPSKDQPIPHEGRRLILTPEQLQRKIAAARLRSDSVATVNGLLAKYGAEAFSIEDLSPCIPFHDLSQTTPDYEQFGKAGVASGRYSEVILKSEHVLPLARTLRQWVYNRVPMAV